MKFATKAIHAGQEPDPRTGAVNVPVYLSSTFKQDGLGGTRDGYEYARTDNPTRRALEATLAALENGTHALAFSSGCAATTAVLNLLQPGDHVVSTIDVYGGTYRLFHRVFAKYGIAFDCLATSSADEIVAATHAEDEADLARDPDQPAAQRDRHRARRGGEAGRARSWRSTTPSPPPAGRRRSTWAPTWSRTA